MLISVETEVFLSPARVLVNPVNMVGVMSSGVSAEFKRFFPNAFSHYRGLCESGQIEAGRLFVHQADFRTVVHLPVKRHWRAAATAEIIEAGLQKLVNVWDELGFHAIGLPHIIDSHLDWETDIRPLVETYLAPLPIPVYLHPPASTDPRRNLRQIDQLLNLPALTVPFDRLWRDVGRLVRRVHGRFTTADGRGFIAAQETGARFRRMTIRPDGEDALSVPESALADLWHMASAARLILPSQFPSGLEPVAPYLLAVLSRTDYVRSVGAALGDAPLNPALLVVPPPDTEIRKLKILSRASV